MLESYVSCNRTTSDMPFFTITHLHFLITFILSIFPRVKYKAVKFRSIINYSCFELQVSVILTEIYLVKLIYGIYYVVSILYNIKNCQNSHKVYVSIKILYKIL